MKKEIPIIDENTIDLLALAKAILNRWYAVVLAMLLFGGAMGAYNYFYVRPTYLAEAQIYIPNTDSIVNLQEVQLSAALTQDYSSILTSRSVLKKVIQELELDMTYQELGKLISVSNPNDTHILKIAVTTGDMEQSLHIANSLILHGIDRIYRVVGKDTPTVIDYAEQDAITRNKPSLAKHAAIGAILGMAMVCSIVVVHFLTDNTVKGEEDVRRITHYDILAEVPEYADEDKQEVKSRGK